MPLDGECIKDKFYFVKKPLSRITPVLDIPPTKLKTCCGACSFKVLADIDDGSIYKNDFNTFDWFFQDVVSAVVLTLQKFNNGDYEDKHVLDSNTLGTFIAYGSFKNDQNENYVGYLVQWRQVLSLYGEGSYRVKCDFTSVLGSGTLYSDEYCMHKYSAARANNTVRLDYYINGIIGVNESDLDVRDYGNLNRSNSLRLNGIFSYKKSTYTKDYTRYNSGEREWVEDEQEPEFNLLLKPMCWNFHQLMRTDVLQADRILITDYNANNFSKDWVQKSVQCTSEYAPNFFLNRSLLASLTNLTFRQSANNLKKFRQ